MAQAGPLVLEIFKQDEMLRMCLYEHADVLSTLRHYSSCRVSLDQVEELSRQLALTLGKADQHGSLSTHTLAGLRKTAQLLWDHLLTHQVKEKLRILPSCSLILSLDEELVNIPWELLYTGEDFLCLKFNLGRLVRTRNQEAAPQYRSFASFLKMLILANPTNDLRSSYQEGTFIRNQFDRKRDKVAIDFKSTNIDTLYVKKNLRDYDIVHFAGHCEYEPDDQRKSGWVLSDGRLTAEDILNMGQGVSLPSLIFSNACYSAHTRAVRSGVESQEKNYSLASAFLFSGVRHYIGSIRRIEDDLSQAFAKEFYSYLLSGSPIGEALRLARVKLAQQQGINAVAWTSYILYGDPNFVLFKPKSRRLERQKKRRLLLAKKYLRAGAIILPMVAAAIFLYFFLPTIKPAAYYTYLRSRSFFEKGRNQEAIASSLKILASDASFLPAYSILAETYHRLGDKENALKYYFGLALASEKKGDKKSLTSAYLGIGWIYHLYGERQKALDFYNKALSLSRENKDKLNEADSLGKLAIWYMDSRDDDEALELLTRSAEINRSRQDNSRHKYNLACDYFNLGLLFGNKGDLDTAEEFYEKSFKIFEGIKARHELSDYYFNIGEIYSFKKQYQKAMQSYQKGLQLDLELGHRFNLASDYNMIGELCLEMDNINEAEKSFLEAADISGEIGSYLDLASAYYNIGKLYKKLNKKSKMREYLRLAQEIYGRLDRQAYEEIKREFQD